MGNKQQGRKSIKEEYLKLVEKKKREYFKKNENVIFACDFRKWKEFVLEEIQDSKANFPTATWPVALELGCREWKTANDNKYRSNIVLFDYLQEHKSGVMNQSRVRKTIIKVPEDVENNITDFDATTIFDFLNSHFDQSTNYIANMILLFQSNFCSKNKDIFRITIESAIRSNGVYEFLSKNLMKELKNFIMIVLQTMIYYYGGLLAKKMQENPSQMYDFIVEKVINQEIHDLLVHCYNISKTQEVLAYSAQVDKYHGIYCKDLQIKNLFCLDLVDGKPNNGFENAIQRFRELESRLTPIQKLEVIISTNDLICESVDDFWKDELENKQDKLIIDADNFLSLYIYICIKSCVKNIHANLWMIKQLGRKNIQNGTMGYFLVTLEACVMQIETLSLILENEYDNL